MKQGRLKHGEICYFAFLRSGEKIIKYKDIYESSLDNLRENVSDTDWVVNVRIRLSVFTTLALMFNSGKISSLN